MTYPSWWADGVRVLVDASGVAGTIMRAGVAGDWLIRLDGEEGASAYVTNPDPAGMSPEVRQLVTRGQRDRVVHDAERALLRAFGCHYVPEYEALPDRIRIGQCPVPNAIGRPELDGIRAVIRGAVAAALAPYVSG